MARVFTGRRLASVALLGAALAATSALAARADELEIAVRQDAAAEMPGRGMTMDRVQARYGTPNQKLAAVGSPPITRWEYPGYVVYFEHQHVIHSVPKRALP
jgi:hypothetical protein